jgi:hypothetical protein
MTESDLRRESAQKENQAIRERRQTEFTGVAKRLGEWLNEQVRMQAEHLRRPSTFETRCEFEAPPEKLSNSWSTAFGREHYEPIWSVNFVVGRPKAFPGGDHRLTFILARKREIRFSFGGQVPPEPESGARAPREPTGN